MADPKKGGSGVGNHPFIWTINVFQWGHVYGLNPLFYPRLRKPPFENALDPLLDLIAQLTTMSKLHTVKQG